MVFKNFDRLCKHKIRKKKKFGYHKQTIFCVCLTVCVWQERREKEVEKDDDDGRRRTKREESARRHRRHPEE